MPAKFIQCTRCKISFSPEEGYPPWHLCWRCAHNLHTFIKVEQDAIERAQDPSRAILKEQKGEHHE